MARQRKSRMSPFVPFTFSARAFKWIRILFRCWKNWEPYEEARYLKQLQTKGVPYLSNLQSA